MPTSGINNGIAWYTSTKVITSNWSLPFFGWTNRSEAVLPLEDIRDTEKLDIKAQKIFLVPFEGKPLDLDTLRHRYKTRHFHTFSLQNQSQYSFVFCEQRRNLVFFPINLVSINYSMLAKLRPRRQSSRRGCKLGTCQLHNLGNTLYHMGQANGKDKSTKAQDPQGFGR